MKKRISILVLALLLTLTMLVSGCSSVENNDAEENNTPQENTAVEENNEPKEDSPQEENATSEGEYIITAEAAIKAINEEGTVLVDAQGAEDYGKAHIDGAVNIARADITVSDDVPNVLAPEEKNN
jgi:PBP1b-binding outer membrane lipoprotein LpoB